MPSLTTGGGGGQVYRPTKFRINNSTGKLEKSEFPYTGFSNFTVKGLNYSPTPPGWTPEYPYNHYDVTSNIPLIKKFARDFAAMGGNTLRVYYDGFGSSFQPVSNTPGEVTGRSNEHILYQFLDECYKNKIFVLLDTYVSFAYRSSPKDRAFYNTKTIDNLLRSVAIVKDHPAIMGYVFGNETNIGYSLINETLSSWLDLANRASKAVKQIDTNHLHGPCNLMDDAIIAFENAGALSECNIHFFNMYPNPKWNEDNPSANNGSFSKWRTKITNGKKFIVTETGYSSWNPLINSNGSVHGGHGAAATAIIDSSIVGIKVQAPGFGFTSNPTVTIVGGGGTGATATATVNTTTGLLTSITVTNGGSGYINLSTLRINITGGGGGQYASAIPVIGKVTGFTMINGGSGYSSAPTVTIGTGNATATATVSGGIVTGLTVTNGGNVGYGGNDVAPNVFVGGSQDLATHASITGQMWDNYIKPAASNNGGGQDVCMGYCAFASHNEQWKGANDPLTSNPRGVTAANDGNYTYSYGYDDSWDQSVTPPVRRNPIPTVGYINPIGGVFAEQMFGFWEYFNGIDTDNIQPRPVVATMTTKWLPQ